MSYPISLHAQPRNQSHPDSVSSTIITPTLPLNSCQVCLPLSILIISDLAQILASLPPGLLLYYTVNFWTLILPFQSIFGLAAEKILLQHQSDQFTRPYLQLSKVNTKPLPPPQADIPKGKPKYPGHSRPSVIWTKLTLPASFPSTLPLQLQPHHCNLYFQ